METFAAARDRPKKNGARPNSIAPPTTRLIPVSSPMPSRPSPIGPGRVFGTLRTHRQVVAQMAKRDMIERYRGSMLGFLWSLLNPLLMLLVYTFVFTVVFASRWPDSGGGSGYF